MVSITGRTTGIVRDGIRSAREATLELRVRRRERLLWGVVVVAMIADLAVTRYGLSTGFTEGNPVARAALSGLGFGGIVLLKSAAVAVAVGCRSLVPARRRFLVPAALAVPWLVAATISTMTVFLVPA